MNICIGLLTRNGFFTTGNSNAKSLSSMFQTQLSKRLLSSESMDLWKTKIHNCNVTAVTILSDAVKRLLATHDPKGVLWFYLAKDYFGQTMRPCCGELARHCVVKRTRITLQFCTWTYGWNRNFAWLLSDICSYCNLWGLRFVLYARRAQRWWMFINVLLSSFWGPSFNDNYITREK